LTLPAHIKVSDLKWISVWCRKFSVDFGNLIFPTEPEVKCGEYSFDFASDIGVISAFKIKKDNETSGRFFYLLGQSGPLSSQGTDSLYLD